MMEHFLKKQALTRQLHMILRCAVRLDRISANERGVIKSCWDELCQSDEDKSTLFRGILVSRLGFRRGSSIHKMIIKSWEKFSLHNRISAPMISAQLKDDSPADASTSFQSPRSTAAILREAAASHTVAISTARQAWASSTTIDECIYRLKSLSADWTLQSKSVLFVATQWLKNLFDREEFQRQMSKHLRPEYFQIISRPQTLNDLDMTMSIDAFRGCVLQIADNYCIYQAGNRDRIQYATSFLDTWAYLDELIVSYWPETHPKALHNGFKGFLSDSKDNVVLCVLQPILTEALQFLSSADTQRLFSFEMTDAISPTYSAVIKNSMDLVKMQQKLDRHEYSNFLEFDQDIHLMVENYQLFLSSGCPLAKIGLEFLQQWMAQRATFATKLHNATVQYESTRPTSTATTTPLPCASASTSTSASATDTVILKVSSSTSAVGTDAMDTTDTESDANVFEANTKPVYIVNHNAIEYAANNEVVHICVCTVKNINATLGSDSVVIASDTNLPTNDTAPCDEFEEDIRLLSSIAAQYLIQSDDAGRVEPSRPNTPHAEYNRGTAVAAPKRKACDNDKKGSIYEKQRKLDSLQSVEGIVKKLKYNARSGSQAEKTLALQQLFAIAKGQIDVCTF